MKRRRKKYLHRSGNSKFSDLAWEIIEERPKSTKRRVQWQDSIARFNRSGELTNEETLRLHALLRRVGSLSGRKVYRRRKTHRA